MTIPIRFIDGEPGVTERVQQVARAWTEIANVTFDFEPPNGRPAFVRIAFRRNQGSWSFIGSDNLGVPDDQPTMNLGWLTSTTDNDEYSRVVLHEFGHMLGAVHEHQNPASDIQWDREAVLAFYKGEPNHWTEQQTSQNIFTRYSKNLTQYTAFDPKSVMVYAIPSQFTLDRREIAWNRTLSSIDKRFICARYPGRKACDQL